MRNCFQRTTRAIVVEYQCAHRVTVEAAIRLQVACAKAGCDLVQCRLAYRDYCASSEVGIGDHDAQALELRGQRTFP